MPDFERLLDKLSINAAPNAYSREYAQGYVAGKKYARLEILVIFVVLYFAIALIGKIACGWSVT